MTMWFDNVPIENLAKEKIPVPRLISKKTTTHTVTQFFFGTLPTPAAGAVLEELTLHRQQSGDHIVQSLVLCFGVV